MDNRRILLRVLPILLAVVVVIMRFVSSEKVTNETGRTARVALSPREETQLGLQGYHEVLSTARRITTGEEFATVSRVAARIERGVGEAAKDFQWDVSLVDEKQANAFCLPGGKIVVYTGILLIAKSEAGLATVIGHEVAHATARHGSERLFKEQAAQTLMSGMRYSLSDMSYENQQWIMSAIGAGAKYGVLMPWGRQQESEADHLGLLYMARAGYDPDEAIAFWQRMEESGGAAAPEWLSTHPSHGSRIEALKDLLPKAKEEFAKASKR